MLENEYNHDARAQSPHLSADRLQLPSDAGSDLETKKSSAPSAGLSWLRIIREYTQQQQQQSVIVLGSDAWLEKNHVKRLGTSLRCQTRVSQRRLGCSGAERSALGTSLRGARHSSSSIILIVDVGYDFLSRKTYE